MARRPPSEGTLEGDVDGDGADDLAYIQVDEDAERGCNAFLVVDTGGAVFSAAVDPSGRPRALAVPSLLSLTELDDEPGGEIVVNIEAGASTQFVGVFTLRDAGIERVGIDGRGPGPFATELGDDDLFAFGGSVGHMEAVDCARDGMVVMSAAIPKGESARRYEVERRFFRVGDARVVLDEGLTETHVVDGADVGELAEYAGSPFGSCR